MLSASDIHWVTVFCYSIYLSRVQRFFLHQGHSYQLYLRSQHKAGRKLLQSHCCTGVFSCLRGFSPKSQSLSPILKAIHLWLHSSLPWAFDKMGAPGCQVAWRWQKHRANWSSFVSGHRISRLKSIIVIARAQLWNALCSERGQKCPFQDVHYDFCLEPPGEWCSGDESEWVPHVGSPCRSLCGVGWMKQDIMGQKAPATPTERLLKIPQRAS